MRPGGQVGGLRGGGVEREEGGDLALVEAEVVEDRVAPAPGTGRCGRAAAWSRRARSRAPAGPSRETLISGSRSRNRPRRSGARPAQVDQRRRQLARGRAQLGDQRVGVVARTRLVRRTVVRASRAGRSGRRVKVSASASSREAVVSNTRFEFDHELAQLALALGQRLEDRAGVAHQRPRRGLLAVEDRRARPRRRRRTARGWPSASLSASPRLSTARPCWSSQLEKAAPRVGVEGAEDLVELDGRRHLALRQRAAVGERRRARRGRPGVSST